MKYFAFLLTVYCFLNGLQAQETIKDIDGNEYKTVVIGAQNWMKENLKVLHYNDGTSISLVMDEERWSTTKSGAYCLSEDKPEDYKNSYGLLYNFYAVADFRKLCPAGWHVPTTEDWKELIACLEGENKAGGSMKEIKTKLWKRSSVGSGNTSGFSALPAGGRGRLGAVSEIGYYATWWASDSYDLSYAWHWGLYPDKNSIRYNPGHKNSGFSVRCIKDE